MEENQNEQSNAETETEPKGETQPAETQPPADDAPPDELTLLKARAKMMGIQHSNNIGIEALKAKIAAHTEPRKEPKDTPPVPVPPARVAAVAPPTAPTSGPVAQKTLRQKLWEENMRLVRLRITNLDPKKKDLPGEIITVANRFIGTVRKYVPYGEVTEEGYHVPYCIYTMLKERRFLNIRITKKRGQEHIEQNWAPEFALEVLPPLTPAELQKLAIAQKAAGNS